MNYAVPLTSALALLLGACASVGDGKKKAADPVKEIPVSPSRPRLDSDVVARIGNFSPQVGENLRAAAAQAGIAYPPARLALVVSKFDRALDAYAADPGGSLRWLRSWAILAASGGHGPKLRQGDLQVPEGFYRIVRLNPSSRFHVALQVGYPNAEDIRHAREEGRGASLGGDIMIHGGSSSIGCIAVGDPASEEIFLLAAQTGLDRTEIVIAPCDFRERWMPDSYLATQPAWARDLYNRLEHFFRALPPPRPAAKSR